MFRKDRTSAAHARQRNRRNRQGRQLSMESMEERRLMAADAYVATIDGVDTLVVEGTNNRDMVRFDYSGGNLLRVSVKDRYGKYQRNDDNEELLKTFNRNSFDQIKVQTFGDRDEVINNTGEKMIADGGSGDDYLWGGWGRDELKGGNGVDKLVGNNGDDLLEGGAHTDYLYGGWGDDTLYGDSGDDWLYGQNNNDGLYGGSGRDRLYAGSGFDRVLRDQGISDYVYNTSADDAVIWFKNDNSTWNNSSSQGWQWFNGKSWTSEEIEAVDEALAKVHKATGNTRLLKSSTHSPITFHRLGSPNTGASAEGWSDHVGNITITDAAFDENMPLVQTVIHEIGHNWDWAGANSTISQFWALSGWTQSNILSSTWVRPGGRIITLNSSLVSGRDTNDGWMYDGSKNNFVREYSRTDPYEDFATSFAAYILGPEYYVDSTPVGQAFGGAAAAPDKMAYMQQFVGAF